MPWVTVINRSMVFWMWCVFSVVFKICCMFWRCLPPCYSSINFVAEGYSLFQLFRELFHWCKLSGFFIF